MYIVYSVCSIRTLNTSNHPSTRALHYHNHLLYFVRVTGLNMLCAWCLVVCVCLVLRLAAETIQTLQLLFSILVHSVSLCLLIFLYFILFLRVWGIGGAKSARRFVFARHNAVLLLLMIAIFWLYRIVL